MGWIGNRRGTGGGRYSLQEIDFSWKQETQSKVESRVFLTFACGFLLDFLFPIVGCVLFVGFVGCVCFQRQSRWTDWSGIFECGL